MDNFYLSAVVEEMTPELLGRRVARISLSGSTLLIDLRLPGDRQLLASLDRSDPAVYLSTRCATQPLTAAPTSTFFLSLVRKRIADARLVKLWKEPRDRIVQIDFEKLDAGDNKIQSSLMLALTGRSANAYMFDAQEGELARLFEQDANAKPFRLSHSGDPDLTSLTAGLSDSMTQSEILDRFFGAGSNFSPQLRSEFLARCRHARPARAFGSLIEDLSRRSQLFLLYSRLPLEQIDHQLIDPKSDLVLSHIELTCADGMRRHQYSSLSEAADQYCAARRRAMALRAEYASLKHRLEREINRRESAIASIESDRVRFEDPEKLKRYGDLLLANLTTARIGGGRAVVVDYYNPDQTEIQIDIPEGATLQEAASGYFRRYQKARRALTTLASREREVSRSLDPLKRFLQSLEREPTSECIAEVGKATEQLLGAAAAAPRGTGRRIRGKAGYAFGRRFRSTDGYEIVVGRNDRDNDALTFRVARPHDIWLHAADYPGSHVVIRNPTREAAPYRTITEAAELAAFYSQAKRQGRAAVHYTQRKFVSKPPRSTPGLVRLSSFKTILVEPRCDLERLK